MLTFSGWIFMLNYVALTCLLCVGLLLGGCGKCPYQYDPLDTPPPLPVCYIPEKVKLALVLGGGGARGLAHLGVLEEFEKANIPIDIIVGCSAGSLVGALYCDNPDSAYVRSVLEPMKVKSFIDINIFRAWYGLSQGEAMCTTLNSCLEAKTFDKLKIPLLTVSSDLYSGELVTIGGGLIVPAVQASCAIPVVFSPIQLHGRVLVDGGVINPVPVRIAKLTNPDIIVAVDLRELLDKTFPTNMLHVATRSAEITLVWQSETCIKGADVIIRPKLGDWGTFDDNCHQQIFDAGRDAAREVIPQILALLAEKAERAECKDSCNLGCNE
jgi:NTE family protein